jgi:hypothetical protein
MKEIFMTPGVKLRINKLIRSQKTDLVLPNEGTLVHVMENLGRTLLLVAFEGGNLEYLFQEEVEYAVAGGEVTPIGAADR